MGTLTIRLFGKLHIKQGDQLLGDLNIRKVQELLAYLLIHRVCFQRRETLAGLLWNKNSTTQSLKYLRQTLWQLQTALDGAEEADDEDFIFSDSDWIGLNPAADLWLDVEVFERAFTSVQGLQGRALDASDAEKLQQAVELYRGNLLEGWYQDWCLYERERLQNMYLVMLEKLMAYCEMHQQYETGIVYGNRALKCDRARERTHRRLMRLHYLAGSRTAALRQYEHCVTTLDEELSVGPAKCTMALYEQIQADQFNGLTQTLNETSPVSNAPVPQLGELLDHFRHFCRVLTDLQGQIEQHIKTMEQVLNEQS